MFPLHYLLSSPRMLSRRDGSDPCSCNGIFLYSLLFNSYCALHFSHLCNFLSPFIFTNFFALPHLVSYCNNWVRSRRWIRQVCERLPPEKYISMSYCMTKLIRFQRCSLRNTLLHTRECFWRPSTLLSRLRLDWRVWPWYYGRNSSGTAQNRSWFPYFHDYHRASMNVLPKTLADQSSLGLYVGHSETVKEIAKRARNIHWRRHGSKDKAMSKTRTEMNWRLLKSSWKMQNLMACQWKAIHRLTFALSSSVTTTRLICL